MSKILGGGAAVSAALFRGRLSAKGVLVAAAALFAAGPARAATLAVPADHSDIASALAAAASGDTVLVDADTYEISSTLVVPAGVTLKGASGTWADTIIDAQGKCQVLLLTNSTSTVSGFTVRNGDACKAKASICKAGSGICLQGGGTVTNCHVTACTLSDDWLEYADWSYPGGLWQGGAGINNYNGAVVDTVIDGCSIANYSIGVGYLQNGSSAVARRCTVSNCSFRVSAPNMGVATGVVHVRDGVFSDSVVSDNSLGALAGSKSYAVGVCLCSASAVVTNCFVANNVHASADGVSVAGIHSTGGSVFNCASVWNGTVGKQRDIAGSATATDVVTTPEVAVGTAPAAALGGKRLTAMFASADDTGVSPKAFSLTATAAGDRTGVVYDWDLDGDGAFETDDRATATLTASAPGNYRVTVRATNAAGDVSTFAHVFRVAAGRAYVDPASAHPTAPYATWDTAAHTLQEALAATVVGDGTEILVRKGTYAVSSTITVEKGVTIRSETNNRDDVVFDGQDKIASVLTLQCGSAVLSGVTVRGGLNGGALSVLNPGGTVSNCHVTASKTTSAWKKAAGLVMTAGLVVDTLIDNCQGVGCTYGYAAYLANTASVMDRCVITNNTVVPGTTSVTCDRSGSGVGIVCCNNGPTVRNTYVAHNNIGVPGTSSPFACGIYVRSGADIVNCTVMDNRYEGGVSAIVGGICNYNGSTTIRNCIVSDNGPSSGEAANFVSSTGSSPATCDHTCAAPLQSGAGNILASGTLVAETDGLPYPVAGSAVLGAGVYESNWMDGARDLAGNARVRDGQVVDIGAIQYVKPKLACTFSATKTSGLDELEADLTAAVDGSDLTGLVYHWDLDGDGVFDVSGADKQTVHLSHQGPASWTVTLKVTVTAGDEARYRQGFTVYYANHYVVVSNPNATPPYASWETAATNIQDAVDAAVAGATVWLHEGTFEPTQEVTVANAVTVRGATGDRNAVVVNGSDTNYIFTVLGGTLADLTVTRNGRMGTAGVRVMNGVMTNCRVTACLSRKRWQESPGVVATSATLVDCLIDHNGAGETDHGNLCGLGLTQYGGRTDRCTITDNFSEEFHLGDGSAPSGGAVYIASGDGLIRNSYVAHNRLGTCKSTGTVPLAPGICLGRYDNSSGQAINCTVYDNTYETGTVANVVASGIYAQPSASVLNCLSVGNGREGSLAEDWGGTASVFDTCCVGDPTGLDATNLAATPTTFRERAGKPRLPVGSNALKAGRVDDEQTGALDWYGNPRTTTRGSNRTICIGCAEMTPGGLTLIVR